MSLINKSSKISKSIEKASKSVLGTSFRGGYIYSSADEISKICGEPNKIYDEFDLHADGLEESVSRGRWISATDSCFSLRKFNEEYKNAFWNLGVKDPKELNRIEQENHEPYLISM